MAKRENGFYWVNKDGYGEVAYWTGKGWRVIGDSDVDKSDRDFTNIDERILVRTPIKGEDRFWRDVPESHSGFEPK